jgi:hypothetical protein
MPWPLRRVMAALGFKYLNLRTFAAHPATLPLIARESLEANQSGWSEESVVDRDSLLFLR